MKKYQVFIDSVPSEIEESDFKKYNVIVNKSNGYSHSWSAIEKFDKSKHFSSVFCHVRKRVINYVPTHLTVKEVDSFVRGTSEVSFS